MVETQANIAKMLSTMQQPAPQPAMTAEDFLKTMQVMLGQNAVGHLGVYRRALDEGVGKYLEGPAIKPVFRKHN